MHKGNKKKEVRSQKEEEEIFHLQIYSTEEFYKNMTPPRLVPSSDEKGGGGVGVGASLLTA